MSCGAERSPGFTPCQSLRIIHPVDLVEALESEHGPLTDRVAELGVLVGVVATGSRPPLDIRAGFVGGLERLRDQLLDHFGREEECYFPFFAEALPDTAPAVRALEVAHDRICGAISRLVHLSARSDAAFAASFPHIEHVFSRFAATYAEHVANERHVLRQAAGRLTVEQRALLAEAARGL
ncbi:MAG: hemerythrin domain-containing protein [Polyangiaceae bacterium]|nr:hemerythrin domain-containing protein [Polyangiaceae bacterium]